MNDISATPSGYDHYDPGPPLTSEQAARRLASVWGLHATAAGVDALYSEHRGPRVYPWREGLCEHDLDNWAAYQLSRERPERRFVNSVLEADRRKPCFLIVEYSDLTGSIAKALKKRGWRVLWAGDFIEALEYAATHWINGAMFGLGQDNVELGMLLFESLTEKGVTCIVGGLIPEAFAGREKLFEDAATFVEAVNSVPVVGVVPLQVQDLDEPGTMPAITKGD